MHGRELVAHAGVAGPQLQRAREVPLGLVEAGVLLEDDAEEQVRVEVGGVLRELGLERGVRPLPVPGAQERLAVQRVREREIGIAIDRGLELVARRREVVRGAVRQSEHQVCLGRVAVLEDAINLLEAFRRLLLLQERHPVDVVEDALRAERRLERPQQPHRPRVVALLHEAVGLEQLHVRLPGVDREHRVELRDCLVAAAGLVEGQCQVHADRNVQVRVLERLAIRRDGLVESPELRVHHPEVRERFDVLRLRHEELPVRRRRVFVLSRRSGARPRD